MKFEVSIQLFIDKRMVSAHYYLCLLNMQVDVFEILVTPSGNV